MRKAIDIGAQALLGLIFFVFGLNGFLNFLPMPELSPPAQKYFDGLMAAGYFFPVLKTVETLCGLCLLARVFAPLALVVLAPIVVQIFLFHAVLEPSGLPLAVVLVVLEAYLGLVVYRDRYAPLLRPR